MSKDFFDMSKNVTSEFSYSFSKDKPKQPDPEPKSKIFKDFNLFL